MPNWKKVIVSGSNASLSSLYASGGITGSLQGTAATASYVNTLNQNVLITGSLTVGSASIGANENTLVLGPSPAGGTGEGGQILLQAPGGTYTSASMWDNYQNLTRLLRGTNAGSDAVVAAFNMHTKQMQLPTYNSLSAFSGTPIAALGVDTSGNVITIQTGSQAGGSGVTINNNVDNYLLTATGTANTINGESNLQFNGSTLSVTGQITATGITSSGAVIAQANGAMYFRGGDDAEFWDINVANTVGIYGQQNTDRAGLKLGSSGPTLFGSSSRFGIGTITPTQGTLEVSGNVYANSFTGSLRGTSSWANNVLTASLALIASNIQGGTDGYIPLWTGSTALASSFIQQDRSTGILQTVSASIINGFLIQPVANTYQFGGFSAGQSHIYVLNKTIKTKDVDTNTYRGIDLDLGDNLYQFGDFNNTKSGSSLIIDDRTNTNTPAITTKFGGSLNGLNLSFGTGIYQMGPIIGTYGSSFGLSMDTLNSKIQLGDNGFNSTVYLEIDSDLGNYIKTYYSTGDIGLNLDFAQGTYLLGKGTDLGNGWLKGVAAVIDNSGTNPIVYIGDRDSNNPGNLTYIELNDSSKLIKTSHNSIDKGVYLDFDSQQYKFGDTNNTVGGIVVTGGSVLTRFSTADGGFIVDNAGNCTLGYQYPINLSVNNSYQRITLNGDTTVTGSVFLTNLTTSPTVLTNVLMVSSSGQLFVTASSAFGGGGSPAASTTKAGSGSAVSFSGSPLTTTITFSSAFNNNNYAITVTGEDARTWTIQSKVSGSFVINSNSSVALTGPVYWIATPFSS